MLIRSISSSVLRSKSTWLPACLAPHRPQGRTLELVLGRYLDELAQINFASVLRWIESEPPTCDLSSELQGLLEILLYGVLSSAARPGLSDRQGHRRST